MADLNDKKFDRINQLGESDADKEALTKQNAGRSIGMRTNPRKAVVTARSLNIRKDHDASAAGVGGLVAGNEVTVLETWTDGKNTWAKLGEDQWAAMIYNGETYIKFTA